MGIQIHRFLRELIDQCNFKIGTIALVYDLCYKELQSRLVRADLSHEMVNLTSSENLYFDLSFNVCFLSSDRPRFA